MCVNPYVENLCVRPLDVSNYPHSKAENRVEQTADNCKLPAIIPDRD
jgi:hypothetical protein